MKVGAPVCWLVPANVLLLGACVWFQFTVFFIMLLPF
eukprot:COSAG05_NODE_6709_length_917_cov_0.943765_1_plen_36_part_10